MKDLSKENQGNFQETLKINTLLEINKALSKEREDLTRENLRLRDELEKLKGVNPIDRSELKANPQKQLSIEKVLEKKLDEIITVLDVKTVGKRRLYADIISNVEKTLIKLALNRTKNIKYEAARFLGINRNTLHKKMNDLNISV
ncbi:MAG: Fis family transcriptional regulator [bacterium]|nr:MAG: Fis family transcriptional regulator [bacterium]